MLSLKQGLSLNTTKQAIWLPSDEALLSAWYRKGTGITESSGSVSEWADQSGNSNDMEQPNSAEEPTIANGIITFDGSDNLQMQSGAIAFVGDYTIAAKIKPTGTVNHYVVIGSNTIAGYFVKLFDDDTLYITRAGASKGLSLGGGRKFTDGGYFVLTRDASNYTLYWNGVQEDQVTALSGLTVFDTIGGRYVDSQDYVGDVTEVQMYASTSAALTANINTRLSTL